MKLIARLKALLHRGSPVEEALRAHHAGRLSQDRAAAAGGVGREHLYAATFLCAHTLHALNIRDMAAMVAALRDHHDWHQDGDPGGGYDGDDLCLQTEAALRGAGSE